MNILSNQWALCAVLLTALPQAAGSEVVTEPDGCKVSLATAKANTVARWTGACVDGKASGNGTLMASNGDFLIGQFRDGKPYDAAGREHVMLTAGIGLLGIISYTKGRGYVSRPFDIPRGSKLNANTPLLGKWHWATNDGACPEVHEYGASGLATVSSGEERIDKYFSLFASGGQGQYHTLTTAFSSNGKPDCQKNITPINVNVASLVYLRFEPDGSFRTCASAEESSCYGRARREIEAK